MKKQTNKFYFGHTFILFPLQIQTVLLKYNYLAKEVLNPTNTETMSALYVYKGGKLVPRDPEKKIENQPKVISYNHVIRHIPEIKCNCEQEKQRLIKEYEDQLAEKDNQIMILVHRIAQKESQIDDLEEEVSYWKNLQNPLETNLSVKNTDDDANQIQPNKSLDCTAVSSFTICQYNDLSEKIKKQELKTEKQMDDCFKKTTSLMNEIDSIMKKRRKYEFHNSILVENSIIEELQMSDEKEEEETQVIEMQDTFCIPQSDYNEYDSLDMTTFESVHNFGEGNEEDGSFYSKMLKDSILLKNTIIQMKQESQEQMNQIEDFYQKQLRISFEELEKERQKNSLFDITKDKLGEISKKGRQALAQLDMEQFAQRSSLSLFGKHQSLSQYDQMQRQLYY